jgi:hypothetical protein
VAVGYIALFGIAVETGVVMVVYLHEALEHKLQGRKPLTNADVEAAAIEGAVQRLRPKLMTVFAVLASLMPILWESGVGSDVMKPMAAPIVGGMITSAIHVPDPVTGVLRHDEGTSIEAGNAHSAKHSVMNITAPTIDCLALTAGGMALLDNADVPKGIHGGPTRT